MHELQRLVHLQKSGVRQGICSVCSSSPFVLDAALLQAKETGTALLVEATANQVNQFGGYTHMTPADFKKAMADRAKAMDFPLEKLILGGDHLGPVVWQKEPAEEAMEKARTLVYDFAKAGYSKIHLDASMPLGGDQILVTEEIARRTVFLCKAAEAGFAACKREQSEAQPPVYVIGSEVPTPGGSGEEDALSVTKPKDLQKMLQIFEGEFQKNGLEDAWSRVVAAVVQPGVEFGNDSVHEYVPREAAELMETAAAIPNLVLEGHSTDYQPENCLLRMVEDGVAILKVGPALTFAAREALYGLSFLEKALGIADPANFIETLESAMLESPGNWNRHYTETEPEARYLRQFSYSDRSRYYMTAPQVERAVEKLLANLEKTGMPMTMLSQFLPSQYAHIRQGVLENNPRAVVLDKVRDVLRVYWTACGLS